MSAAARILERLDRPKQTRPGSWIAACPVCQSKRGRPLSVRELPDGRVLIHDFAGCEVEAVLNAVGLKFADLYDKPLAHHMAPVRAGFSAAELLQLTAHEASVAAMLADKAAACTLSPEESTRLILAAGRLGKARGMARGR
jgi:hypothetical protein